MSIMPLKVRLLQNRHNKIKFYPVREPNPSQIKNKHSAITRWFKTSLGEACGRAWLSRDHHNLVAVWRSI